MRRHADFDRDLLNRIFADIRSQGLIARQSFMCCNNCAGSALATNVTTKLTELWKRRGPVAAKRAYSKIKGAVFYHLQARDALLETGKVYINYGPLDTAAFGSIGLPPREVGDIVVAAAQQLGAGVEWNGDPMKKILLDVRTNEQRQRDEAREKRMCQPWL